MTTAATSLLGLALPVTGELSGTWGDTVNNSITSLLDTAVAGTTTLSTDSDVTLSTTTLAANQARQAIILWTANGTTTRNITAPAQSKIYTVINASAGTQSIVLRGAGPTTGVTIVKGESAVCAWNGSDFIKISNTGGSASFTNVTVSGTTTLSGLTASTALALNSSKEVVSVTNTGTGNNVLSASPTLTGTISAAALTLSSDLTLSGGTANGVLYLNGSKVATSGSALTFDGTTLLVSNASSVAGIFNRQSANGKTLDIQVVSSSVGWLGSNGSGDFVITSSSGGVASNNISFGVSGGTEAMRLTSSSLYTASGINVGIGTSSPGYPLVASRGTTGASAQFINTASYGQVFISSGGTNQNAYLTLNPSGTGSAVIQVGNSDKVTIDSSGNLGLGVTPSAWSLGKAFEVGAGGNGLWTVGNANIYLVSNTYYASGAYRYASTNAASAYEQENGVHKWRIAASGTAGDAITFTQAMTLDADGDLGVGTTSPAFRLDVLASGATTWARIGNGGSNNGAGLILGGSSTTKNWVIANQYNVSGGLEFTQTTANGGSTISSTPSMLLDSSGNLLVGTTSATDHPSTGVQLANASGVIGGVYVGHASGVATGNYFATFSYDSGIIGSITQNGVSQVLYNISSDQRLKENIANADSASALIDALQVRKFDWKADGSHQRYGFIAQELVTVAPEAVHQPADPEQMMAVDYSKLVPMLVKEIQSLRARVASLES